MSPPKFLIYAVPQSNPRTPLLAKPGQRFNSDKLRFRSAWNTLLYANDPKRPLASHCSNVFDASFGLYQSVRLSRYNADS